MSEIFEEKNASKLNENTVCKDLMLRLYLFGVTPLCLKVNIVHKGVDNR